jgi:hypothetical protein
VAETALPKNAGLRQGDFRRIFADRIEPDLNSGCHLWSGSAAKAGYGTLTWLGGSRLTHRCAYECENGVGSADGHEVRHKCDTPTCVNPAHLLIGTRADNMQDMLDRGRGNPPRGERHAKARLSEAEVLEARRMAADGRFVHEIAEHFGVRHNTMESAVKGWSWKHLSGAVPRPLVGKSGRRKAHVA